MIRALIKLVFKIIYSVIALFNLQLTLFLLLVGAMLFFTGTMANYPVLMPVFQVALVLSIIYAIVATLRKALGIDKKVKKSKGVQIVQPQEEKVQPIKEQSVHQTVEKPRYFSVKQNPNYVMAEFNDRYELYLKTKDGLEKIRTDYKVDGEKNDSIF